MWLLLVLPHLKHFKFRDENSILVTTTSPQKQTLIFDPLGLCLLPLLFPIPFITLIFINITLLWEPCFTVFSEMSPGIESYSFPLPCLLSPAFKLDVLVDRSALQDAVLHDKQTPLSSTTFLYNSHVISFRPPGGIFLNPRVLVSVLLY